MMRFNRFGAAVLLALVAVVSAQAGDANVGRASGVKVLLVGDTKPFPGGDVDSDLNTLEARLKGLPGFEPARDLRILKADDVTANNILKAVDDLDVRPTDALFCYYGGHGAYDPDLDGDDPSGGHYLQIPSSGDLRRAELMRHLTAKGARLTVLITDICNVRVPFSPDAYTVEPPDPEEDESVKPLWTGRSASLETLLFDFTGVVDVNAAARDQSSWSSHHGCCFTQSLLKTLDQDDTFRDPFRDGTWLPGFSQKTWELTETWGMVLDRASEKANGTFHVSRDWARGHPSAKNKQLREQEDQRAQVFQLEVRRAEKATEKDDDFVPPSPFGPDGRLKSPWEELLSQEK